MVFHLMMCHDLFDPFIVLRAESGSLCICAQVLEELGQLEWPVFQLQILNGEASVTDSSLDYANVVENTKFSFHAVLRTRAVEASIIGLHSGAQGRGRMEHS